MSTITKLDPRVRRDRAARRELLTMMRRKHAELASELGLLHKATLRVATVSEFLGGVARSSWRTGASKNALFTRIAKEVAATPR